MERLAIRARRTGRQATKMPLTCERAEDSSDAFNIALPSVPPSGIATVEEPSVSFKMAFWSLVASFWSFSIVSKYERHCFRRFKSEHTQIVEHIVVWLQWILVGRIRVIG